MPLFFSKWFSKGIENVVIDHCCYRRHILHICSIWTRIHPIPAFGCFKAVSSGTKSAQHPTTTFVRLLAPYVSRFCTPVTHALHIYKTAITISKWTVTQSQRVPSVTPLFLICQSTVTINDCVCNVNIWNVNCSQTCNSIHFRLANRYPCRSEGVFVTEYVSPEEESNPILQIQSE